MVHEAIPVGAEFCARTHHTRHRWRQRAINELSDAILLVCVECGSEKVRLGDVSAAAAFIAMEQEKAREKNSQRSL